MGVDPEVLLSSTSPPSPKNGIPPNPIHIPPNPPCPPHFRCGKVRWEPPQILTPEFGWEQDIPSNPHCTPALSHPSSGEDGVNTSLPTPKSLLSVPHPSLGEKGVKWDHSNPHSHLCHPNPSLDSGGEGVLNPPSHPSIPFIPISLDQNGVK